MPEKPLSGTSPNFWFEKNDEVYDRYAPTTKPADLKADIAKLLAE